MIINDATRSAFSLLVVNALSLAILFGIELSGEQVAGINSVVNSTLIVFMLLFKKGSEGDPSVTAKVTETKITTTEPQP